MEPPTSGSISGASLSTLKPTDSTNVSNHSASPIFFLHHNIFTVSINGCILPVCVLVTIVTNLFVCVILLRPNMRSATNMILVGMAIADTLTGIWPLPCYFYFYLAGHYLDWVPYSWCYAYFCLTDFLPTIFHTASIWLTVALAVQRYIFVCHSFQARGWCTVRNATIATVVVHILAVASQAGRFFDTDYFPVQLNSRLNIDTPVIGCQFRLKEIIKAHQDIYFNFYYLFRIIFIHLVPCLTLVIMNALLVYTMRVGQRRRSQLLMQNRKTESRRLADINHTTLMLVTVVGLFLLVEFPLAILLIMVIVQNMFEVLLMHEETAETASTIVNLIILLSYPMNFFIYCGMSTQFRSAFTDLFKARRVQLGTGSTTCPQDGDLYVPMSAIHRNAVKSDAQTFEITESKI